jgi:hypothetical protein
MKKFRLLRSFALFLIYGLAVNQVLDGIVPKAFSFYDYHGPPYWLGQLAMAGFGLILLVLWDILTVAEVGSLKVLPVLGYQSTRPLRWRPLMIFQIAMTILILAQVVAQVNLPLDSDENFQIYFALTPEFGTGNQFSLFGAMNHTLATVLSVASVKLWGTSKLALRLPSIGFAILSLGMLNLIGGRVRSFLFSMLMFGSFAANRYFLWYMQSSRGYSAGLFFTLVMIYLLIRERQGSSNRRWLAPAGIAIASGLGAIAQNLVGLAGGLLVLAWAIWAVSEHRHLDRRQIRCVRAVLGALILVVPALTFVGERLLTALSGQAMLQFRTSVSVWSVWRDFMGALGFVHSQWAMVSLGLALGLLAASLWHPKLRSQGPVAVFMALTLAVFAAGTLSFRPYYFCPRYVLGFAPWIVFWISTSIVSIPDRYLRAGSWWTAFLFLVLIPAYEKPHAPPFYDGDMARFDAFATGVKERLNSPRACLFVDDLHKVGHFANAFQLGGYPRATGPNDGCAARYVVLWRNPKLFLKRVEEVFPGYRVTFAKIYEKDGDQFLYQVHLES